MLGAVLAILDATVVNVAIPAIATELGASVGAIGWVMTAYLLAFASVIRSARGRSSASGPAASS